MPKLRKTAAEIQHDRNLKIADLFRCSAVRQSGSLDKLLTKAGMSRATWFRRTQNPENFTLGEIQAFVKCLDAEDKENLRRMIFS